VLLDIAANGHVLLTRTSILRTDITHLGDGEGLGRDVSWFSFSRLAGLSRDGHLLLFNRFDQGAGVDYQIGVRRTDEPTAVPIGSGVALALSPDGRLVLGLAPSDPSKLSVFPVGAGETRTVSAPGFTYGNAAWFPDGTRLLVVAESAGQQGVYIQDLSGSAPRRVPVASILRSDGTILVSPDSRWFAARSRDGGPVIGRIDDGRVQSLSGLGPDDDAVAVSGDGKSLFVQRRDPESQMRSLVLRYDLASGRLDLVRRVEPADLAGVLDRPTCLVTPDGRTIAYAVQRYLTDLYLVEGLR
jgi:Tol biopolymer transport system component